MASSSASISVGVGKKRKRPLGTRALKQPRAERQKMVRFRDNQGRTYSLPKLSDSIEKRFASSGFVDADDDDDGSDEDERKAAFERFRTGERRLLYVTLPRVRKIVPRPMPGERLQLRDLVTKHLFSVTVSRFNVVNRDRNGYCIVGDIVDNGIGVDAKEE